jgi:hypothetical protein
MTFLKQRKRFDWEKEQGSNQWLFSHSDSRLPDLWKSQTFGNKFIVYLSKENSSESKNSYTNKTIYLNIRNLKHFCSNKLTNFQLVL